LVPSDDPEVATTPLLQLRYCLSGQSSLLTGCLLRRYGAEFRLQAHPTGPQAGWADQAAATQVRAWTGRHPGYPALTEHTPAAHTAMKSPATTLTASDNH